MKSLKFKSHLVPLILSGEKTSTWRLFDDKDLKAGDWLEFINAETLEKFGEAKIIEVKEKTLGTVESADFEGHETYVNNEEMYAHYRNYYGDQIGPDTPLKIIKFEFKAV